MCGDCADQTLLINEDIEKIDVFCAVTNDDETNIIACMQARRLGAKQVMALISRTAYVDLVEGSMINIAISPQQAMIGSILRYVRSGDIVKVHTIRHGTAEAIEAIVHGDEHSSKIIGKPLAKIGLPEGSTLGAVIRAGEVIIPHHDTIIQAEDHVVIFIADKQHTPAVGQLFQLTTAFI